MTTNDIEPKIPKKRGRKPLQKNIEPKIPKKRGRKPKGGKIITTSLTNQIIVPQEINIILHLKCTTKDIKHNNNSTNVECYKPSDNFLIINHNNEEEYDSPNKNSELSKMNTVLFKKIRELAICLHNNNIINKKSDCFWCTHPFSNPPIYIPKFSLNGTYQCYGCFCSPECATAFLFKESLDNATRFERYHILNYLYGKIYNYTDNFKPAPNPYYTLDKYYGNLSIEEYRCQIKRDQQLFIVDKPLTRVLPELLEDNNDFILNQHSIPSSNKFVLRKKSKQTKSEILTENFNLK
jgi:hypothetical protein